MDFSYLTRLGLRSIDDPRIRDTITIAEALLRVETPSGPVYRRYNGDSYGEKTDGAPSDGSGVGRLWPLLTGERGHLALQAGEDALPYLETMLNCVSSGGMLPEQVWDSEPIPERGLEPGRPSGSAMPLLWTHAEYLKLLVARDVGRPVELLEVVEERYAAARAAETWHWRPESAFSRLAAGRLIIEYRFSFELHYGFDSWQGVAERSAKEGPAGIWGVTFEPAELASKAEMNFTHRAAGAWVGTNQQISFGQSQLVHSLVHEAS